MTLLLGDLIICGTSVGIYVINNLVKHGDGRDRCIGELTSDAAPMCSIIVVMSGLDCDVVTTRSSDVHVAATFLSFTKSGETLNYLPDVDEAMTHS